MDQNSSHIKTGNNVTRSMVVFVHMRSAKAKQQGDLETPKIQAARQNGKLDDILPDEVEEFDAIVHNARKKLDIPVPGHQRRKLQCQRMREATLSIERRATLFDNRDKQMGAFESERCILHKGPNHSHEDCVADRGSHSWHHYKLWHTRPWRSAEP